MVFRALGLLVALTLGILWGSAVETFSG